MSEEGEGDILEADKGRAGYGCGLSQWRPQLAGGLLMEVMVSGPEGWRGGWQDTEGWTLGFGLNIKISKNGMVKTFQPSLNF